MSNRLLVPKKDRVLFAPAIIRPKAIIPGIMLPVRGIGGLPPVTPGSATYNASGSLVLQAFNTITFTLWGPGGGGCGFSNSGTAGGPSSIPSLGLTANSGGGGRAYNGSDIQAGAGGTASGGTSNYTGGAGISSWYVLSTAHGGNGANGGGMGGRLGGGEFWTPAQAPGGGGYGGWDDMEAGGAGGGGGGCCVKTYTIGQLTVGSSIPFTIGTGGTAGYAEYAAAEPGQAGRLHVVWS